MIATSSDRLNHLGWHQDQLLPVIIKQTNPVQDLTGLCAQIPFLRKVSFNKQLCIFLLLYIFQERSYNIIISYHFRLQDKSWYWKVLSQNAINTSLTNIGVEKGWLVYNGQYNLQLTINFTWSKTMQKESWSNLMRRTDSAVTFISVQSRGVWSPALLSPRRDWAPKTAVASNAAKLGVDSVSIVRLVRQPCCDHSSEKKRQDIPGEAAKAA